MSFRSRGAAALLGAGAFALVPLAGVATAAPAAAATAPTASAAQLSARRCQPRSVTRCGRVVVPLDRSGAVPGTISLRVRMRDGEGGDAGARSTVIALAGGPGQAATPLLEQIGDTFGPALRNRRLVTFDQRGTGGSGRLRCPELARIRRASQLDAAVAACARRLGARRTAYTTAASVEDLEAVRSALGVERFTLYAVSYGTKVALDYAARHPQHVSRLVLDSVVPQSGNDPFQRATIGAIPRVLKTLCGGGACRFTPDATADLATLVRRAAQGPLRGRWFDGRGRAHSATLDSDDLFSLLLAGDFDPRQRAAMPAALRAAAVGDIAPLLSVALRSSLNGGDAGGDSDALFIATTCEDGGVPWPAGTPVEQRAAATEAALAALPEAELAPFDRRTLRQLRLDSCRAWPESPIAQPTPPLPDVPTLILSGDADLRTPRSDALEVAAQLPRSRVLTVPGVGHSVLGTASAWGDGCVARAVRAFFGDRAIADCRSAPGELPTVRPLTPRRLADVPRRRGLPPRVGRTYDVFELTFLDATEALLTAGLSAGREIDSIAIGGLRGGSARISARALRLDRYSLVEGVTVSVTLSDERDEDAPVIFRIGGRAAARGTLRVVGEGVRGTLGGQPVHIRQFGSVRNDGERGRTAVRTAQAGASAEPPAAALAPPASPRQRIEQLRTALAGGRAGAATQPASPVAPLLPGPLASR